MEEPTKEHLAFIQGRYKIKVEGEYPSYNLDVRRKDEFQEDSAEYSLGVNFEEQVGSFYVWAIKAGWFETFVEDIKKVFDVTITITKQQNGNGRGWFEFEVTTE